jgi:hypothetical protein
MSGEDRPLDLAGLSAADKDRLIRGLWADLRDERAKARALEARLTEIASPPPDALPGTPAGTGSLLEELRRRGTRKGQGGTGTRGTGIGGTGPGGTGTRSVKVRLGRGLGLLRSRAVIGFLAVVVLAFVLDFGLGWYQQRRLAEARLAELRLQKAAFTDLFVELGSIAYEPDGKSYRLSLTLQNLDPERPIYVMLSAIRVFEQSGLVWHEVPARAPAGERTTVVKLTDRYSFQTIFEPNLKDWTELIPGYMHIRFDNDMLISQRSEPESDIVERDDASYVYLKPHGADDAAIRRRMNSTDPPPVYIPMPPH